MGLSALSVNCYGIRSSGCKDSAVNLISSYLYLHESTTLNEYEGAKFSKSSTMINDPITILSCAFEQFIQQHQVKNMLHIEFQYSIIFSGEFVEYFNYSRVSR